MKEKIGFFSIATIFLCLSWVKPCISEPTNVIIMIADGWGFNQVKSVEYWNGEKAVYDDFPIKLAMSTYPATNDKKNPTGYDPEKARDDFSYPLIRATGSGASATALSTGVKTIYGMLGTDPDGKRLKHIIDRAEEHGMSTGVVTSVQFCHATPAGFVINNPNRSDYKGIAFSMLDSSKCEIIMGAGHPFFDDKHNRLETPNFKYFTDHNYWNKLRSGEVGADADNDGISDPWEFIETVEQFTKLSTGETPKRVFGLGQVFETLQANRKIKSGEESLPPYSTPYNRDIPSLSLMVKSALNVLDNNSKGFMLMIEGGAIDWAGHRNNMGMLIEEMDDFNKAVEVVIDWVTDFSTWEETLLIVTGDHETGYLGAPATDSQEQVKRELGTVVDNGKGKLPGFSFNYRGHSNLLVPFFAKGKNSEHFLNYADEFDYKLGKYLDNTEVALAIFGFLK